MEKICYFLKLAILELIIRPVGKYLCTPLYAGMDSFDKLIEKRRYDEECIEYRLIGSAISFAFAEIGIGIDETKNETIGNFWLF